ncbi:hypothetical protein ABEX38_30115 [Priestia megaterium]
MREEVENPMVNGSVKVLQVVARCKGCEIALFADEDFLDFDGDYFCEEDCLLDELGVTKIEGSDLL